MHGNNSRFFESSCFDGGKGVAATASAARPFQDACLPACLLSRPLFGVVGGCGWRPAEGRPGKGEGSREGHGTCKSARAWLQAFPLSDSVQNRSPKRCPSLRMKHFPPGCNYVTYIHTDIHTYMMIFEYLRGSWSKANPCAVA